jgi:hypothetical protein
MRLIIASCALLGGCALISPLPDMRTASDRARELSPKCSGAPESATAQALTPSMVESVEPAYSYVSSGPVDRQARLRGARIHLRPAGPQSREALQRGLECHEVSVLLGRTGSASDDPYALDNVWLDISVDSEGDGFVVLVRTESLADAKLVLDRARRFVGHRA